MISNMHSFAWNLSCAVESIQLLKGKLAGKWSTQFNESQRKKVDSLTVEMVEFCNNYSRHLTLMSVGIVWSADAR